MVVSKEIKHDILVIGVVVAILAGIVGTIYYYNSTISNETTPIDPDPIPIPTDNNETNPIPPDNDNDTIPIPDDDNNTNPLPPPPNNNDTQQPPQEDYFDTVCNIEPKAEVCIKPNNGTNSTLTN